MKKIEGDVESETVALWSEVVLAIQDTAADYITALDTCDKGDSDGSAEEVRDAIILACSPAPKPSRRDGRRSVA